MTYVGSVREYVHKFGQECRGSAGVQGSLGLFSDEDVVVCIGR